MQDGSGMERLWEAGWNSGHRMGLDRVNVMHDGAGCNWPPSSRSHVVFSWSLSRQGLLCSLGRSGDDSIMHGRLGRRTAFLLEGRPVFVPSLCVGLGVMASATRESVFSLRGGLHVARRGVLYCDLDV
jgi:hypothetical protein